MKDLLLSYGFTYDGSCHCEGYATVKYNKDDYQIRIRESRKVFKVKKAGRSLTMWVPVDQLEEALKSYFNVAV